jgi:SAM-dependent methyltransferase
METPASTPYVCPECRGPLSPTATALVCPACGLDFPVEMGIADFARGVYYDSYAAGQELPAGHLEGLENEIGGTRSRIEGYYLPLLHRLARRLGLPPGEVRVLDCGCGNGLSVDLLRQAGFAAWGNDLSALRKWQWRERGHRDRLAVADARKLPFPDGFFHAVLSSGVIEHIGVEETGGETYTVKPLPDRDTQRVRFLGELLRVVAPRGELWLDFPNGAFPIDFWHGPRAGGARVHPLDEGFLPTITDVRGYLSRVGPDWRVRPLSPHGRLACRQVRRHWYGRLLYLPAAAFLWSTRLPGLRGLAGSPLNPYLVLAIGRAR